jgi:hypothetical protein
LVAASTAAHSPRLELLIVTSKSMNSIRPMVRGPTLPSDSEIAHAISSTVRNPPACIAINAATQVSGPISPGGASA